MKILVYGAGVLGCNLARNLFRAGKDVTLLARGKWAEDIRKNGLRIKDKFSPRTGQAIGVGVAVAVEDLKANLTVQSRCFFIFPINLSSLSGHSSYTPGSKIHNRA